MPKFCRFRLMIRSSAVLFAASAPPPPPGQFQAQPPTTYTRSMSSTLPTLFWCRWPTEINPRRRIRTIKRLDTCRATPGEPKHQHLVSDSLRQHLGCPLSHGPGGSSRVEDSGQCASGRWTQPSEVRDDACSHDGQRQASPIDDSTNTKHPAQMGQDGTKSRPPESRERSPCRRAYTAQDQVWFRLQEQCL